MAFNFNRLAGILTARGTVTPLPIQLGANGWYNFSDASKFVEGDTDKIGTWLDGSTFSNDISQGSSIDQPGWISPGPSTWDGSDFLEGLSAPSTNSTWIIKINPTSSAQLIIFGEGAGVSNQPLILVDVITDELGFRTDDGSSIVETQASGVTLLNTDNVIGLVKTGTSYQWYVNGSAVGSPIIRTGSMTTITNLGGRGSISASARFVGNMDHASVYPSSLTAQNIADLTTAINAGEI